MLFIILMLLFFKNLRLTPLFPNLFEKNSPRVLLITNVHILIKPKKFALNI